MPLKKKKLNYGNTREVNNLQELTKEEITELLGKEPTPPLYYKFNEYKYNTDSKERVLSGIEDLDRMTNGFELGCITIWTGQTNAGKTTVMTMLTKQTILQNEKVFYFNGEQTKDDFKNNLYKQTVDKKSIYSKQYKQSCVFDSFVADREIERLNRIYGENLILYNNEAKRTIDLIIQAMEEVRVKDGVRVFMLDNFMQIDTTSSDEYREQKEIMEKLRTFAVNKNVHIHLVAHPRKTDKANPRITIYDVMGSSNLVNKAYNVISIVRIDNLEPEDSEFKRLSKLMLKERYDITRTSSVLEVLKTKGTRCGVVGLQYDSVTKSYKQQPHLTDEIYEKMIREDTNKKGYAGGECPF